MVEQTCEVTTDRLGNPITSCVCELAADAGEFASLGDFDPVWLAAIALIVTAWGGRLLMAIVRDMGR